MSLATIEAPGTARPPDAIALQALIRDDRVHGSLYCDPAVWALALKKI